MRGHGIASDTVPMWLRMWALIVHESQRMEELHADLLACACVEVQRAQHSLATARLT